MSSKESYDNMCAAIAHCAATLESELDRLPVEDQLRVCARISNADPQLVEGRVSAIRLRAEWCHGALLRHLAGLPPRSKREAQFLANWCSA